MCLNPYAPTGWFQCPHDSSSTFCLARYGLKSLRWGQFLTSACAAGLDFAGEVFAQQIQLYCCHCLVQRAPLVLPAVCEPVHPPIAQHQSLSVPEYCAVWTALSSCINKKNPRQLGECLHAPIPVSNKGREQGLEGIWSKARLPLCREAP